jgi:hypothetical protein
MTTGRLFVVLIVSYLVDQEDQNEANRANGQAGKGSSKWHHRKDKKYLEGGSP